MPLDTHSLETAREVARKALEAGARQLSLTSWDWEAFGRCLDPQGVEVHGGQPSALKAKRQAPIWVRVTVPCRKCRECLNTRRRAWTQRALCETDASARTWFGTYTLSPHWHHQMAVRCRVRLDRQRIDFDRLDTLEQLRERHREISAEFTKYWKRLRKSSGAALRYMLVLEKHDGGGELHGLPHYHALIHEVDPRYQVLYRTLCGQWPFGHSALKLVTERRQVYYTCKYISKDATARIRASIAYGSPPAPFGIVVPKENVGPPSPGNGRSGGTGTNEERREEKLTPKTSNTTDEVASGDIRGTPETSEVIAD